LKVRVQYFASVRELINLREELIEVPPGTTVRYLLDALAEKHGDDLRRYLFDDAGNPHSYLQFIIDEEPLPRTSGLSTVLKDASVFAIVPPVGGG
jgi:MoaD family protein